MNKTTTSRYTYADFATEVMHIVNGEIEVTDAIRERVASKAADLLATQTRKAEYNATHPKKGAAKGPSAATKEKAAIISEVLTAEPMTAAEISKAAGVDFTALQVANAVKFIEGVTVSKVVRDTTNSKGLRMQKEYTAYAKA